MLSYIDPTLVLRSLSIFPVVCTQSIEPAYIRFTQVIREDGLSALAAELRIKPAN